MSKPGIDGHWRGIVVVSRGLRDAGMEVIYSGLKQTPKMIVNAAIQEDVDVVGLSILSSAHLGLSRKVIDGLREKGAKEVVVIAGGVIPERDIQRLKELGVQEVFPSGTPIGAPVDFLKRYFNKI